VNFLFAINLSNKCFYKNDQKIILKFVVLIIHFARPGAILPIDREITCIKKA
jgi:hypothetical protein